MSGPGRPPELAEREARLKDGRALRVRHGRAGDEAGIARLLAPAFPLYRRAAGGDLDEAVRRLARYLAPEEFVVGVLAETGEPIGASCISGRGRGLTASARLRHARDAWGLRGLVWFLLERVRRRLLEPRFRPGPGELYRYLSAVETRYRSLGVARHIADFIDDYARAAGYHTVSAIHSADNAAVLALHRKRGCVLVECPHGRLARWFGYPADVKSTRSLHAPASGRRAG